MDGRRAKGNLTRGAVVAAAAAVILIVGAAPRVRATGDPAVLVILEEDEPQTPYPFLARSMSEQRLGELLFDRLYVRTDSGFYDSAVFEGEVKAHPGRLQLHVREELRFSDGGVASFPDVAYSIDGIYRRDDLGHDQHEWFGMVFDDAWQITERAGELRFRVPLPEDHPEQLLTTAALFSRAALDPDGDGTPDVHGTRRSPVGTGPFHAPEPIESFDDVLLSRNPQRPGDGDRSIERIRLLYDQDAARQRELMLGHKADLWVAPPPAVVPEFANQPAEYRVVPYDLNQWWYLALDTRDDRLADPAVREALDLLVPRAQLMEKFGGSSATPISGPFRPGSAWCAPDLQATPLDPTAAHALLEGAGYARGGGGRWSRDGVELSLVLGVQSDIFDDYNDVVYALTDGWEIHGIRVKVRAIRPTAWRDEVEVGRAADHYDLILGRWNVDREESGLDLFLSPGDEGRRVNLFGYTDPEVDVAVEAFYGSSSGPEREAIMRDVHHRLHASRPYLFLWSLKVDSVVRHGRLAGVVPARFYYYTGVDSWRWRAPSGPR